MFVSQFADAGSANTHQTRLMGLGKFEGINMNRLVRAKEEISEIEAYTREELDRLESAVESPAFRAAVAFLEETALRFAEFVAVKPADFIQTDHITYLRVLGKGRKVRRVPLSKKASAAWEMCPRNMSARQQNNFRLAVKAAGERAGLRFQAHPHILRASKISLLLNGGANPAQVAAFVGHSSLDVMMKSYFAPSMEALNELVA